MTQNNRAEVWEIEGLIDAYWALAYTEGKEGRNHDTTDGAAQRVRSEISDRLRALSTSHPEPTSTVQVSVRPLEWKWDARRKCYEADTPVARSYKVQECAGSDSPSYETSGGGSWTLLYEGDDLPAAKAAAQADCKQRILSALSQSQPAYWHNGNGQIISHSEKTEADDDTGYTSRFTQPLYSAPQPDGSAECWSGCDDPNCPCSHPQPDAKASGVEGPPETAEIRLARARLSTPPTEAGVEEPEVERWALSIVSANPDVLEMQRDDQGDWVRLSDHNTIVERLERELDRINKINADHCRAVNTYIIDNARLDDALTTERERSARLREALEGFGKHKRYSLGFHSKVYGDDDDEPTHDKWVIWDESGSINDREWDVVATGATPLEAIAALRELKGGEA